MPCSVKNAISRLTRVCFCLQLHLFLKYQLTSKTPPHTGSINNGYFVWCNEVVFINCIFVGYMFILKQYVTEKLIFIPYYAFLM